MWYKQYPYQWHGWPLYSRIDIMSSLATVYGLNGISPALIQQKLRHCICLWPTSWPYRRAWCTYNPSIGLCRFWLTLGYKRASISSAVVAGFGSARRRCTVFFEGIKNHPSKLPTVAIPAITNMARGKPSSSVERSPNCATRKTSYRWKNSYSNQLGCPGNGIVYARCSPFPAW